MHVCTEFEHFHTPPARLPNLCPQQSLFFFFFEPMSLISFFHPFICLLTFYVPGMHLLICGRTCTNNYIELSILYGLHLQRVLNKGLLPRGQECSEIIDKHLYGWKVVESTFINFAKGPMNLLRSVIALSMRHNLESPRKRIP